MTPTEQKAKELVEKFGHLAPDVCDEILRNTPASNFENQYHNINAIKSECEKILKEIGFKTAEDIVDEIEYDDVMGCWCPSFEGVIKAMHEFAKQSKTII